MIRDFSRFRSMGFRRSCRMDFRRIIRPDFRLVASVCIISAVLLFAFCLPRELFGNVSYSTVVMDKNGELLGARIADDGQWRFPPSDTVPRKFGQALVEFEDRAFRWHPGVNPGAVCRALWQNIREGERVSGGSTITMQVIRMSRGKERNLWQKIIEAVLAVRLELRYSKDEILALYASYAPFGGNVVGLEAAAWRYFGRASSDLSWGEAATLAVLPNSPSLIHPGKNRDALFAKRNRLLEKMLHRNVIDSLSYSLACDEPLPEAPLPLPQFAPHLVEYCHSSARYQAVRTSVDISLQRKTEAVAQRWCDGFAKRGIGDLAYLVVDVKSGEVLSYGGNIGFGTGRDGSQVDVVRAGRSTGSVLKPILYAALLQDGDILPNMLMTDIPVNINGFSPQNFDRNFYGAVPASEALARSLNVPSVHSLRKYGFPKFYDLLKACGMTTLDKDASHYGLSLILGGAEGTLWDIVHIYAAMAAVMEAGGPSAASESGGVPRCDGGSWVGPDFPLRDRTALWYTFDALSEVNRPDEMDWRQISSLRKVFRRQVQATASGTAGR